MCRVSEAASYLEAILADRDFFGVLGLPGPVGAVFVVGEVRFLELSGILREVIDITSKPLNLACGEWRGNKGREHARSDQIQSF